MASKNRKKNPVSGNNEEVEGEELVKKNKESKNEQYYDLNDDFIDDEELSN